MANELKALIAKRVELLARLELAHAQHAEAIEEIDTEMLSVLEDIATYVEAGQGTKTAPKRRTKPKPKEPDHDATAKRYADFDPSPNGCLCGCGEDVNSGSNFVKGHQNRLRSIALAVAACKMSRTTMSNEGQNYAINMSWISGDDLQ